MPEPMTGQRLKQIEEFLAEKQRSLDAAEMDTSSLANALDCTLYDVRDLVAEVKRLKEEIKKLYGNT